MPSGFSYSSNAATFLKQFADIAEQARVHVATYERLLVETLNDRIMALTPVWEGETLINYVWSVGSPILQQYKPLGSGPPGNTNAMSLGSEPRRAENEAAVRARLVTVLAANLPADIYLTNSAPEVMGLEYGLNPTPGTSRVHQGGMVRLAIKEVVGQLRG